MKKLHVQLLLAVAGLLQASTAMAAPADAIYLGGDILTMKGKSPQYAQALAVRDGKIAFVGTKAGAMKLKGESTKVVDLGGATLLPGFIDGHGHMIQFGKNLIDANLFGIPNISDLLARMKDQAAKVPEGGWIVGFGYQAKNMTEGRTPTVEELDTVSADRPVMVVDSSGHLGAGNSALFKLTGISASTADPAGGNFSRKPGSRELLGPMEETALNAVRVQRPAFSGEQADQVATGGAAAWARYGQTTAQECGVGLGADDISLVRNAIDKKLLPIDLYVCAKDSVTDSVINAAYSARADYQPAGTLSKLLAARPDLDKRYINRVRLGGIKFWLDGSVDTAWFAKPYAFNPPGKTGEYSGYEQISDATLDAAFDKFWATGIQLNMHMNGDAAAEQALRAIERAVKKHGMRDHRPVFIHASYLRPDQIDRMKKYGAVPSFLTASLPTAGDIVVKLWGEERAAHSMAAETMIKKGIAFSFSHDAPVSPSPAVLPIVDAGVNRRTASGVVVGPDERVSPYDGLRAVTAMAAYQIKEEKTKGTLERGKLADMVILEKNPLKVDPLTIKDIQVLETLKEGQTVYQLKR
jgi:predicted amidohydrolase YtcJ